MGSEAIAGVKTARLIVPDLIERPVIATGCCAFAAGEILTQSVREVQGVTAVTCDEDRGVVVVEFDPASTALTTAAAVLDSLGYPVTAVEA